MTLVGKNLCSLIVGSVFGVLIVQFVHLGTHRCKYQATPDIDPTPGDGVRQVFTSKSRRAAKVFPTASSIKTDIPDSLFNRVRILCLIMTHAPNYQGPAVAINSTWARRCNRYVFVGSNATPLDIPLIRLNITESRSTLWQKTWMSLGYAAKIFNMNEFDFVLKADDDTFVVMENLRLVLLPLDPSMASFTGRHFLCGGNAKMPFMSGGAGYVLSRRAFQLFVQRAITDSRDPCNKWRSLPEDVMMGSCLLQLGVKFTDSRDSRNLERFHPYSTGHMIGWGPTPMPVWMNLYKYYPFKTCLKGCVSSVSVSFHYVPQREMYIMEFLLYGMRPVGVDPTAGDTIIDELLRSL